MEYMTVIPIKAIKDTYWYNSYLGQMIDVEPVSIIQWDHRNYRIVDTPRNAKIKEEHGLSCLIAIEDCMIVDENNKDIKNEMVKGLLRRD